VVAAFFVAFAAPVNAQTFPERPVRILVPYAPGGITDIAARIVGAKLGEYWGRQVVVENRPGGNRLIAMTAAVRRTRMPYDVERDLVPITGVSDAPIVLTANSASRYKSVADVIAASKSNPGSVDIGTAGVGSITHLVLEWLALNTGTKGIHYSFRRGMVRFQRCKLCPV
jgi:tripartite-type tricarboxylate transporter receptor subunit TctC